MKNYKLEVTSEEMNLILGSLAELSYKVSSRLITNLSNQANEQSKKSVEPKKKVVKKVKVEQNEKIVKKVAVEPKKKK